MYIFQNMEYTPRDAIPFIEQLTLERDTIHPLKHIAIMAIVLPFPLNILHFPLKQIQTALDRTYI
jgi:hypothetical protein